MLYFRVFPSGALREVIEAEGCTDLDDGITSDEIINRNDIKTFAYAEEIAREATLLSGGKETYLACDYGEWRHPRYDVCVAPKVGDKVSYATNGDYYPDGTIVSVSPTYVVKTQQHSYRRRRLTASWQQPGGTWSLISGHHNIRNPSF